MSDHLPDWVLQRYRLGELPPERMQEVRVLLDSQPELAQRLAAMDTQEAALLERLPPRVVAARARPAQVRRWALVLSPAVALAAVALVVLSMPTERAKGAQPFLRIHHQVPAGLEELQPGDSLRQGEVLQVHYAAMGQPWGIIWSEDGRGAVTVHLPTTGEQSAPLTPEGTVALPASYTLDDAPHFERFSLVTCSEPFSLKEVIEAHEGCTRTDFELRKP